MMDQLFGERQRQALRTLVELTSYRGRTEAAVLGRHDADSRANQQEFDASRTDLEQFRESELSAATTTCDHERKRILTSIQAKRKSADLEYEAERDRIADKAAANLQEAEKQRQEAIWATETVFDAKKDQPRKLFEQTVETIDHAGDTLRTGIEAVTTMLRRMYIRPAARSETGGAEDTVTDGADEDRDIDVLLAKMHERVEREQASGLRIGSSFAARMLLGLGPLVVLIACTLTGAGIGVALTGGSPDRRLGIAAGAGAVAALAILAVFYTFTRRRGRAIHAGLCDGLHEVEVLGRQARVIAEQRFETQTEELRETRENEIRNADETFQPIHDEVTLRRDRRLTDLANAYETRKTTLEQRQVGQLEDLKQQYDERVQKVTTRSEQELKRVTDQFRRREQEIEETYENDWAALESRWLNGLRDSMEIIEQVRDENDRLFPAWNADAWSEWEPPLEQAPAVPFGALAIDRVALEGGLPEDERLRTGDPERFALPAPLVFPRDCSLLIEYGDGGRERAVRTLQNTMLRLLTSLPPGKARFTIIDPVGLGESFAGFMHLADYDEQLVGARIWTETRHIEQRLADLTEHIENVIQKYLRNEFETIAEYNRKAGEIAEPYRFLVISDLPSGFSEIAARRLASIVSSGARCGLYTLIGFDARQKLPTGIELADLRQHCLQLVLDDDVARLEDDDYRDFTLTLDAPPDDAFITATLQKVGQASKDTSRVEVPFEVITPDPEQRWSVSTAHEVRVPLGRAGATKLQYMTLGHGTSQHVLIAGKTGSGKSTLLHAMITNLALWCSPDEIEFYLVDFKKGVEFKAYAKHRLPHARVIAIESDREFGLSVLQRVDAELRRRGRIFRELEVQDMAGYRQAQPEKPMPRVLLVIDEFQEFFVEDDKVAQDASLLLDRLIRQGRAFGIHVLLGSQTLGGAYSLARSTLGQMAVRIALQCSESDSYLILSDDNSAARLLSRPGEAIYNDASGMVEGNNPFQISWLADVTRDACLDQVEAIATERRFMPPDRQVVFEGNVPADVDRNHLLNNLLDVEAWPEAPKAVQCWLGDAIAIKDPSAVTFRRQSGSNMMIVGQRDESALAMMGMSLISLAAQHAPDRVRINVLDGSPTDSPNAGWLEQIAAALPHAVRHVAWREVETVLGEVAAECERRQDADDTAAPAEYLVIFGLQRYRMLRPLEDFSFSMDDDKPVGPDKLFTTILREGPNFGMHTMLWVDTMTNLERVLDRSGIREFDNRVLFQMSATDSTNLIDSPAASRMGIRRAMLYNEEQGQLEKFRPYALPDEVWLEHVRQRLCGRMVVDR